MRRGFTLIELIVVIIIVGILAAVGISQYSLTVEKSRLAEARIRIGVMKQLAYQYWLENGTLSYMTNADLGVDYTCASTDYYKYSSSLQSNYMVDLIAVRCTSGGKAPPYREYKYWLTLNMYSMVGEWHCGFAPDGWGGSCFGLPGNTPVGPSP